ncbi:VOC family protein [Agrococcus versicolor]|uniref:VOC family protein n=1 Tax=Agrococcus versicolor TaxID=501482 RepID=A0ABP5MBM5_9MICO
MTTTGPDFIALQVRDVAASAAFYERHLGLVRQAGPPSAAVFDTKPAAFAVRPPMPGIDLDAVPLLGHGVSLWMHATDVQAIHDGLVAAGVEIVAAPTEGPFGLQCTFADPDGYRITLHDRA